MTNPSFTQVTFRFRKDDGNETGATWLADQGTNISWPVEEQFRLRFRIDETASRAWSNKTWNLYYSKNSGTYTAINDGTVDYALSSNFAQGADTTSQLTGGTGTFVTDNNGMCESAGATNSGTAGYLFEVEYCIVIKGANAANNDTFDFRVYDSSSAIATYTATPRLTAMETIVNTSDSISLTESRSVVLPDNLTVNKSESVSLTEDKPVYFEFFISKSDSISLTENILIQPIYEIFILEDAIFIYERKDAVKPGTSYYYKETFEPAGTDLTWDNILGNPNKSTSTFDYYYWDLECWNVATTSTGESIFTLPVGSQSDFVIQFEISRLDAESFHIPFGLSLINQNLNYPVTIQVTWDGDISVNFEGVGEVVSTNTTQELFKITFAISDNNWSLYVDNLLIQSGTNYIGDSINAIGVNHPGIPFAQVFYVDNIEISNKLFYNIMKTATVSALDSANIFLPSISGPEVYVLPLGWRQGVKIVG